VSDRFLIRTATIADVEVIARHRAAMFRDMGSLPDQLVPALESGTITYLRRAVAEGEYVGWLAAPTRKPGEIIAGAGVQVRRVLPFPRPDDSPPRIASGLQAIVLNVYTERGWRRQGLARMLMARVIDWARAQRIDSLVLHASADGRALYEQLGFAQTNEMRYEDDLAPDRT